MSWNFSVQAATKDAAKKAVADKPDVKEWKYCPQAVVTAINAAIDALPDSSDKDVSVSTNGHIAQKDGVAVDDGYPNATISVKLISR